MNLCLTIFWCCNTYTCMLNLGSWLFYIKISKCCNAQITGIYIFQMYRIKITIVWVLGYDTFFMTKSSFFSDNTARIVHPFQHSRRSRDFHHLPTAQYLAHGGWPPGKSSSQSNSFINMGPSYHVTCVALWKQQVCILQ